MADDAAQLEWVGRVLGVSVHGTTSDTPLDDDWALELEAPPTDPMTLWINAKDKVDAGLNALIGVIRGRPSPMLQQIAEFGLFGLTEGQNVALNKALREYQGATGPTKLKAAQQVQAAAQAYRALLSSRRAFALIDDNPYGIEVGLLSHLDPALTDIARAVS
jgi:hypothetical protein